MPLENFVGNLKYAYAQVQPGTMRHADQLITERRTNHDLRGEEFYTADGNLYTVKKRKIMWGITREPQNAILQSINLGALCGAYEDLIASSNFLPGLEGAQFSFEHPDTVVVDVRGLELVNYGEEHGYFVVDPENVQKLNTQQKLAAQRIYGPDEDNFRQNLELFAKAGKRPLVFVLMPEYVLCALRQENYSKYLATVSQLSSFDSSSGFNSAVRIGDESEGYVRGVPAPPARAKKLLPNRFFGPKTDPEAYTMIWLHLVA